MKLRILPMLLSVIALPAHAIRMPTARALTGLSAITSTVSSAYVMQKCGAYLPEMSAEMYASLVSAYVIANTAPTGYWLYKKTPQGRLWCAKKDLKKIMEHPLMKGQSDESALGRMSRVYVYKDFPYIESLHALQAHDTKLNAIKEALAKARKDMRDDEHTLLESYSTAFEQAQTAHTQVHAMIKAVRDLPDYTKRLKYFNEQQAQTAQAEAQKEQAKAQKVIAGASVVGAFAKVIEALNPFKK